MSKQRFPSKIIPPQHERFFARERLITLAERKPLPPLIWINGPAGSGKTVFTTSLLQQQHAHFLWYRIDGSENKCTDLFYFLTLAAKRNYPRKRLNLPIFTAEYCNDVTAFARIFFRQLFSQLENETALVLDNFQETEDEENFNKVLLIAVSELPQDMQIYCLSRNRPNHLLSRLKVNNELLEIGAASLQFTELESLDFLTWLNPQLDAQALKELHIITQGWATGMVLLAAPQHQQQPNHYNDNKPVVEYLLSEVLTHLRTESLIFLVKTALFEQLTAKMARQLTHFTEAQKFLDTLVNKNLLIEKTAGSKPIYTYHPLLREALLARIESLFNETQRHNLQNSAAEILIKEKKPIEAMSLYLQLQNWLALENLVQQQAGNLVKNGRHHTLSHWIKAFPDDYLRDKTWLNYWHAEAIKPVDPILAAKILDKCYLQFNSNKDTLGLYSAWQAAVEAINISMDGYSDIETWIQRFDQLRTDHPPCPSIALKVKFYGAAVQALTFCNPQHTWFKDLIRNSERAFAIIPIKMVRALISTQLAHYYLINAEMNKLQVLVPHLECAIDNKRLPAIIRIVNTYILSIHYILLGHGELGQDNLQRGLDLSEQSGITLFKGFLEIYKSCGHICLGDIKVAQESLDLSTKLLNPQQRLYTIFYHSGKAWIDGISGELAIALEHSKLALEISQEINMEPLYYWTLALKTQLLAEMSQWDTAQQDFQQLSQKLTNNDSKYCQLIYHLTDAWLAYLGQDYVHAKLAIKRFLVIVRNEQILFFGGWRPNVLAPLCILAIENDIEADFAVRLMSLNKLFPDPPLHLEQWPWPVRIYCFNQLRIVTNQQTPQQSPTRQNKTNALLAAIIALGAREVDSYRLLEMLWPDADGDMAQQSLETTLHRLRKQIGKQAILVKAGKISINSHFCWLDVWAFEATADELETLLLQGTEYQTVVKLTDRLLNLYQGPFLNHTDSGPLLLKQERLQNTFNNLLNHVADFHEEHHDVNGQ